MMKYIYAFILTLGMTMFASLDVNAATSIEIIEQEQAPAVALNGSSSIRVSNANGLTVYIYNVAGVCVQTIKVDGLDRHYDLNLPKGCYIVKVGKTVRKISIK